MTQLILTFLNLLIDFKFLLLIIGICWVIALTFGRNFGVRNRIAFALNLSEWSILIALWCSIIAGIVLVSNSHLIFVFIDFIMLIILDTLHDYAVKIGNQIHEHKIQTDEIQNY